MKDMEALPPRLTIHITWQVTEISICTAVLGEGAEVDMNHPGLVCLLHVVNAWDLTVAQALPLEGTQSL